MEDVLQECGDACGSFCTALLFFAWALGGEGQLSPLPLVTYVSLRQMTQLFGKFVVVRNFL